MQSLTLNIKGRVQGVFFRRSTKDKADALGLSGFVRNERDGSVYVEVSGPEEMLGRFVNWCHRGPELARVDSVEVLEVDYRQFNGFEIRR